MGKSSRVATRFGASSSGDAFCKDLPKFRVISISIFFFSSVHELFLEKEDEELGERRREKETDVISVIISFGLRLRMSLMYDIRYTIYSHR